MYITHDLGTAAYLMVRGCRLSDAYIDEKKVFVFKFEGDVAEIRRIAIDYLNSDCAQFDSQIKNLKKLLSS